MTTLTIDTTSLASVLRVLSRVRLYDLGRVLVARIRQNKPSKSEIAALLAGVLGRGRLPDVLRELGRDELRTIGKAMDLVMGPSKGQVPSACGRQWLVEDVAPGEQGESPLVKLACLDDDAPGKALEILWDLEIGAEVVEDTRPLPLPTKLDEPAHFGAYLHALKWRAVSAADATRSALLDKAAIAVKSGSPSQKEVAKTASKKKFWSEHSGRGSLS